VVASSPAVADGIVYVGSLDGKVYALNATTGALVWNFTTGWEVFSSPAIASGVVYVGSEDGNVYALGAVTGALVWNYTTGAGVYSSPAVAGGVVYVGSQEDRNVYALDAVTGALVWKYTTGDMVWSSPAVVNGVVYVGSDDYNVYAFGPAHDVAVTDVVPYKTVVGRGCSLNVSVTSGNLGDDSETFNLTLYVNTAPIGNIAVNNLPNGTFALIVFVWNTTGLAYGNYTMSAYAWPVPGEINTADNNFTEGTVEVTIPGDVNGDGTVNKLDAITLGNAFLATPGSSNWNPNADINGDGVVDILDAIILGNHFLQQYG
jgi:hypothetical protein